MSVRSFPNATTESGETDYFRLHTESGETDYFRLHTESGTVSGLSLTFNGLSFALSVGEARSAGMAMLVESQPFTGASTPTESGNARRDLLVARRTLRADGTSDCVPLLLVGTPAPTPIDPTPKRVRSGVWDEPLWSWMVPGAGGTAVQNVVDRRRGLPNILQVPSMAERPTELIAGTRVRFADRPHQVFACDGRVWVQEGVNSAGAIGNTPTGGVLQRIEDTAVVQVGAAAAGFACPLPVAFSAAPLFASIAVGDVSPPDLGFVRPLPANFTPSALYGQAYTTKGEFLSPNNIRVTYVAYGYNT